MKDNPTSITLDQQRQFIGEIARAYSEHRFARRATIEADLAAVLKMVPGDPVLELGAGGGVVLEVLRDAGRSAFGVEVVPEMVAEAASRGVAGMVRADGTALPFSPATFALITLWGNTLGPIPGEENRLHLLREAHRVLKSGGWLVVTALNAFSGPRRMLQRREFTFRFPVQPGKWSDQAGYNRIYTRGHLKKELRAAGFKNFKMLSGFTSYMHIMLAGK